ncbi:MAG: hypothetical protein ACRD5H_10860 [Nitrososphaerales archaeon]
MSAEDAFNQVPPHITKYRIGDGMMWYTRNKGSELDFYAKNVKVNKHQHIHFWFNSDEYGAGLTNENRRGMDDEHPPFNYIQWMKTIAEPVGELLASAQHPSPSDNRFTGRVVILTTLPNILYDGVSDGKAYFQIEPDYSEYQFEDIDVTIPQIGVMAQEPDVLTDFVVVGKGQIHTISMDVLNTCADKMAQGLRAMGLSL